MIADQWYPLLQSSKLGRKPVGVRRMGERLVLWRDGDGRPVCMRDRCPHRGVALSRGRVRDGALECGYHGFRYGRDGQCLRMPCEGEDARIPAGLRAHTLPVEERYGLVWLFWGHADERPEIPWFDFIGERRRGTAEAAIEWPLNYVRTLESNFDLHHTPWLHGSIVPVGTRLDPFEVETNGTRISARGELRRPGKRSGMPFRVEFVAPSVTYIELTKRVYLVNAAARSTSRTPGASCATSRTTCRCPAWTGCWPGSPSSSSGASYNSGRTFRWWRPRSRACRTGTRTTWSAPMLAPPRT